MKMDFGAPDARRACRVWRVFFTLTYPFQASRQTGQITRSHSSDYGSSRVESLIWLRGIDQYHSSTELLLFQGGLLDVICFNRYYGWYSNIGQLYRIENDIYNVREFDPLVWKMNEFAHFAIIFRKFQCGTRSFLAQSSFRSMEQRPFLACTRFDLDEGLLGSTVVLSQLNQL